LLTKVYTIYLICPSTVAEKMAEKKRKKRKPQEVVVGQFNFVEGSYLESTRRPLYALLFLLPLVGLYELGTFLLSPTELSLAPRIIAFSWLEGLMEVIGVKQSMAWAFPGLLVLVILFCWHLSSRYPWPVRPGWLGWMGVECGVLTVPLFVMAAISPDKIAPGAAELAGNGGTRIDGYFANVITSIGAGIYEELVFRLILMGLIVILLEDVIKIRHSVSITSAVLVSALLFAAHHYIGLQAGRLCVLSEFETGSFLFRTAAGIYFAVLFHYRGFGITAGTHSAYDIIYFTFS